MSADMPTAVQIEELRGRINAAEAAQKGHEDICLVRYTQIFDQQDEFKHELRSVKSELKEDIMAIKTSLGRYFLFALATLVSLSAWALHTLYDMQQDTDKALIQMAVGAQSNSAALPNLPTNVQLVKRPAQ